MTWSSKNVSVHDYEVGFSSTSNSSAPDIMAFRSTKQHQRLHIMHSDLPEGTPFYIVIKTISKANVEGIQVIFELGSYMIFKLSCMHACNSARET